MHLKYLLAAGVASLGLATSLSAPVAAQEVTSTIRGTVDSGGSAVDDASVTIVHEPSGTRSTTTTGSDGSFNARFWPASIAV